MCPDYFIIRIRAVIFVSAAISRPVLQEHLGYRVRKCLLSSPENSGWFALCLAMAIPSSPQGTADLIASRFDRLSEIILAGQDIEAEEEQYTWRDGVNATSFIDWYARQQVAYYYPLASQDKRFRQGRTALGILIALKRYRLEHGQWPARLERRLAPLLSRPDSGQQQIVRICTR